MPATAFERFPAPIEHGVRLPGRRMPWRSAPFVLPLLIALALTAIFAGSGAAGACSGTGITLADLPGATAALRGALG